MHMQASASPTRLPLPGLSMHAPQPAPESIGDVPTHAYQGTCNTSVQQVRREHAARHIQHNLPSAPFNSLKPAKQGTSTLTKPQQARLLQRDLQRAPVHVPEARKIGHANPSKAPGKRAFCSVTSSARPSTFQKHAK